MAKVPARRPPVNRKRSPRRRQTPAAALLAWWASACSVVAELQADAEAIRDAEALSVEAMNRITNHLDILASWLSDLIPVAAVLPDPLPRS